MHNFIFRIVFIWFQNLKMQIHDVYSFLINICNILYDFYLMVTPHDI